MCTYTCDRHPLSIEYSGGRQPPSALPLPEMTKVSHICIMQLMHDAACARCSLPTHVRIACMSSACMLLMHTHAYRTFAYDTCTFATLTLPHVYRTFAYRTFAYCTFAHVPPCSGPSPSSDVVCGDQTPSDAITRH